jgi:hypothetical protein
MVEEVSLFGVVAVHEGPPLSIQRGLGIVSEPTEE